MATKKQKQRKQANNPNAIANQREAWLVKATGALRVQWSRLGVEVPIDVKVSCGFPGGGSPRKRIGECWPRSRSAAGVNEVWINPTRDGSMDVLDILGHELLHAVDDCKSGHRGAFNKNSAIVGYSGGKQSSIASQAAVALAKSIIAEIGEYPHAKVALTVKNRNASHGLHKLECGCGNVAYMTAKKLEEFAFPACGSCEGVMYPAGERQKKKTVETI